VTIDYSKRWQQVHIRAMTSSYGRSPYFQYYYEHFEKILLSAPKFLLDLNDKLLHKCLGIINVDKCMDYTSSFCPVKGMDNDYRYKISPKVISGYSSRQYIQVFNNNGFIAGLSILDLIFNLGPGVKDYL
jgi:hypothetical protein